MELQKFLVYLRSGGLPLTVEAEWIDIGCAGPDGQQAYLAGFIYDDCVFKISINLVENVIEVKNES